METAERAETLFHELDANPDGGITEEEFIRFKNYLLEKLVQLTIFFIPGVALMMRN